MTNPFPYNQIIAAYSPTTGPFSGYSFAAAVWANGLTMAEFQRNAANPTDSYVSQCVPGMDANGSSNSCLTFLIDQENEEEAPPYYFIGGSTGNHIILYSFTPAAIAQELGSACINQLATVATLGAPVAALSFDPTTGTLFVADTGGGLHVYFVRFDPKSGIPDFTLLRTKTGFAADTQGQIQILTVVLEDERPHAFVTGLTQDGLRGVVRTNAVLDAKVMPETPAGSVAMVPTKNGIFVATATGVEVYRVDGQAEGAGVGWSNAWTAPTGITLTSACYCSMTGVAAFPQGVLLIGGYAGAASNTAACGVIYRYDLATGTTSALVNGVSGPVYGLVADQSVYALYANGSNGLGVVNLMPGGNLNTVLVANTVQWKQENSLLSGTVREIVFLSVSMMVAGGVWANAVFQGLFFGAVALEVIDMEELGNMMHRNDSWRTDVGDDVADLEDLEDLHAGEDMEDAHIENLDQLDDLYGGGEALEIEDGMV